MPDPVAGDGRDRGRRACRGGQLPGPAADAQRVSVPMPRRSCPAERSPASSAASAPSALYGGAAGLGCSQRREASPSGLIPAAADARAPVPEAMDFAEAAAAGVTYRHRLPLAPLGSRACGRGAGRRARCGGGSVRRRRDAARLLGARTIAPLSQESASGSSAGRRGRRCGHRPRRGRPARPNQGNHRRRRDVVVDPVGRAARGAAAAARAAAGGRFVTIGFASGEIPAIPLWNLVLLRESLRRRRRRCGRSRSVLGGLRGGPGRAARDLMAKGAARPHIGARSRCLYAAAALRCLADREALGKVLVEVTAEKGQFDEV
ncbi:zinc-binding dehydrogenase [Streptomyces sp. KL116D]|uniref:zinc-binding dehydrogenase n=1 Tax=Streptomyces sp. KL116D TaxID=3045152 RepID=UPI003556ACCE